MKKIIFHADDFNLTQGVSEGIIFAHRKGVVGSTSVMTNLPDLEYSIKLLKENPNLDVGVHINLTCGFPISPPEEIPFLSGLQRMDGDEQYNRRRYKNNIKVIKKNQRVNTVVNPISLPEKETGDLIINNQLINKDDIYNWESSDPSLSNSLPSSFSHCIQQLIKIPIKELHGEITAQVETLMNSLEKEGIDRKRVSHLDSHHHIHRDIPAVLQIMTEIARKYQLGIRHYNKYEEGFPADNIPPHIKSCDNIVLNFFGEENISGENIMEILKGLPGGNSEIMCHPGFCDEKLKRISSYNADREKELKLLSSPHLREFIKKSGIYLITYRDL